MTVLSTTVAFYVAWTFMSEFSPESVRRSQYSGDAGNFSQRAFIGHAADMNVHPTSRQILHREIVVCR